MAKGLFHLSKVEVCGCNSMKEIVLKDNNLSANNDEKIEFLQLQSLTLEHLETLDNFFSYYYLTHSGTSLDTISNLEKIIAKEERNNALKEDHFFKLEKIILKDMDNLKTIWYHQFEISKILEVNNCKQIVVVFPSSMQKTYNMIEMLEVTYCDLVEEIFELNFNQNSNVEVTSHLKEFTIDELPKLKKIWSRDPQEILNFENLIKIELNSCSRLEYLLPLSIATRCSHLKELSVNNCASMKEIVAEEKEYRVIPKLENVALNQRDANMILQVHNTNSLFSKMKFLRLSNFKNEEATFPYWYLQNVHTLESLVVEWSCFKKIFQGEGQISEKTHTRIKTLSLNKLPKLQHICEKGSPIDPILEFLEGLGVYDCSSMKNLFPSSVNRNHLEYLEIGNCNGLKYLITSHTARSLDKLTTLKIKDCNSLEEIITGVENVGITFISLEILMLECLPSLNKFCSSNGVLKFPLLEEGNLNDTINDMFEDKDISMLNVSSLQEDIMEPVAFRELKYLALSDYLELKDLWYGKLDHKFCNLKHLVVERCDYVSHVLLPSNVLQALHGVEELEDPYEIINFENLRKVNVSMCQSLSYIFPYSLCQDLQLLQMLEIDSCGFEGIIAMEERSMENFQQPDPVDENHDMQFKQAMFFIEKLSINLEDVAINGMDALRMLNGSLQENIFLKIELLHLQCFDETPTIFLNDFHALFPNLKSLMVHNSYFEILFTSKATTGNLNKKIYKQVKHLCLYELENIKYIWHEDFPLDHPLLQDLEVLEAWSCPNLINLIRNCELMLDVVKIDEEKVEEDVMFKNLEYLELHNVPSLRSFCYGKQTFIFPSLICFLVEKCPRMKIFTSGVTIAPYLAEYVVREGEENMRWKDDLNTTIEQLFVEQVAFGSFKHLKLSEYPELKELWYGPLEHNMFRSLECLVVHKCNFLSEVLFQSNLLELLLNLEELDIKDCNSLEAVFYYEDEFAKEVLVKNSSQLKKLKLSNLPKLKHVWKENPHSTMRFQNLNEVSVEEYRSLISNFPHSVARDMILLQDLLVSDSGIEEIVANEEGTDEIVQFVFSHLTSIRLEHLPKLKAFFVGVHSLQFLNPQSSVDSVNADVAP
ncbi:Rpp4C4, putative [Medicago truncatula]|uniref:Rpp4C4, putative n=1 Tax=Medicago truncatula TaxID=3880 RepID=A0A072VGG4_MEDTR|nr:Rpp4C4, putative [Medicago truncatula]